MRTVALVSFPATKQRLEALQQLCFWDVHLNVRET